MGCVREDESELTSSPHVGRVYHHPHHFTSHTLPDKVGGWGAQHGVMHLYVLRIESTTSVHPCQDALETTGYDFSCRVCGSITVRCDEVGDTAARSKEAHSGIVTAEKRVHLAEDMNHLQRDALTIFREQHLHPKGFECRRISHLLYRNSLYRSVTVLLRLRTNV